MYAQKLLQYALITCILDRGTKQTPNSYVASLYRHLLVRERFRIQPRVELIASL